MFRNRQDAGRQLAARITEELDVHDPVVLGIPRGGVILADVIARLLGAETDVVLARKLPAPYQPELAIGAVAESGDVYITPEGRSVPGVTDEHIEHERKRQLAEIERRREMVRRIKPPADLAKRTVIVTDDGIATGSTMIAGLQSARLSAPAELICAVPVASPDSAALSKAHCDRLICLHAPAGFFAISQFYDEFEQVSDEQMLDVLAAAARRAVG